MKPTTPIETSQINKKKKKKKKIYSGNIQQHIKN